MRSLTTRDFWHHFSNLPTSIQKSAVRCYQQFRRDPHHSGLQFKKISGTSNVYSVRVSLGYRAVGTLRDDTIVWFWIGTHLQYERLLKK